MMEEYNYNEQESGRTETLVGTIEELEKVKKQLEMAINGLAEYANIKNWYNTYRENSLDEYPLWWYNKWKKEKGYRLAQNILRKIEKVK